MNVRTVIALPSIILLSACVQSDLNEQRTALYEPFLDPDQEVESGEASRVIYSVDGEYVLDREGNRVRSSQEERFVFEQYYGRAIDLARDSADTSPAEPVPPAPRR